VYLAYCTPVPGDSGGASGQIKCVEPTTNVYTLYGTHFRQNRPFFLSSGAPGATYGHETRPDGTEQNPRYPPAVTQTANRYLPNTYNGRQPPNMFSFDEMAP
jgi:hypothetical protein